MDKVHSGPVGASIPGGDGGGGAATVPMLERMARAICSASCGTPDALDYEGAPRHWAYHLPEARAALEAIREPSRVVTLNMDPEGWDTVIDSALDGDA